MESKSKFAMMKLLNMSKTIHVVSVVEVVEGWGALVAFVDLVKFSNALSWLIDLFEKAEIGLEQVVTQKHTEVHRR